MSSEEQIEKDKFYMGRALVLAEEAFGKGEVPVGAVIVCRDRIIARAHNLTEALTDVTAHAEIEPCVMCAGALGWSQIKRIVYGCSDEKRGYSTFAPQALHKRTIVTKGIREEECKQLMQQFFKQKR